MFHSINSSVYFIGKIMLMKEMSYSTVNSFALFWLRDHGLSVKIRVGVRIND